MSFRSIEGRNYWHFCTNCPTWPEDSSDFDEHDDPPREQWCKTCVRMYEAGTGILEWTDFGPRPVFTALCDAWAEGTLNLKPEE